MNMRHAAVTIVLVGVVMSACAVRQPLVAAAPCEAPARLDVVGARHVPDEYVVVFRGPETAERYLAEHGDRLKLQVIEWLTHARNDAAVLIRVPSDSLGELRCSWSVEFVAESVG
jgi:hypothetical protein